jgi:hypothetical protein
MTYSLKTIQAILMTNGISQGVQDGFSCDEAKTSHTYFYPFTVLTSTVLLEDSIAYFLSQKVKLSPRRVCFLLKGKDQQAFALVIQLSQPNLELADQLYQYLFKANLTTIEGVLSLAKSSSYLKQLKQLYNSIHCLFIGSAATSALVQQLKEPMQQAYSGQLRLDFLDLPATHSNVVLTEYVLSMLKQGKTNNVDVDNIFSVHHKQCLSAFIKKLEQIAAKETKEVKEIKLDYPKMTEALTCLVKYQLLEQKRMEQIKTNPNSSEEIEMLLAVDNQFKKAIYAFKIPDLTSYLRYLNLDMLTLFLTTDNASLLEILIKTQTAHYQHIKQWEQDWQSRLQEQDRYWLPYLWRGVKKTSRFLYQNSLGFLGAELMQLIGNPIISLIGSENVIQGTKELVQQTAKWTIFCFTLSPRLARASYEKTGRLMSKVTKEHIPTILKATGASLGLAYSYTLGIYPLIRTMLITSAALKISEYRKGEYLHEEKATVVSKQNVLSAGTWLRILSLTETLFETVYSGHGSHFIGTLGGVMGSISTNRLASYLSPTLKEPQTEEQAMTVFMIAWMGQNLGYILTSYTIEAWLAKLVARERVLAHLKALEKKGVMLDLEVKLPSSANPLLFFTATNPMTLIWRNQDGFFSNANCQIGAMGNSLQCDPSVLEVPRLL